MNSLLALPIDPYLPRLVAAVKNHHVVIVNGPPGCGKSSRIMPALIAGLPREWTIFQTQPRPMLVRSAALRMLEEHQADNWRPGVPVGFIAGADRCVFPATRGIILSDQGMVNRLTSMSIEDPTVIMVDEAHLRSSQTDVLLGMLNILLKIHAGMLRVIISSATAEVEKIAAFFGGAEVIDVVGRIFPVTQCIFTSQNPLSALTAKTVQSVLGFLDGTYGIEGPQIPRFLVERGALAAVLSGEDEVEYVAASVRDAVLQHAERFVPLGAEATTAKVEEIPGGELLTLPHKTIEILKDYRAFEDRIEAEKRMRSDVAFGCLRVIIATEIIRTGVTIKNLVELNDRGLVKRLVDNDGTGRLEVHLVSQAEVQQAQGRLGRVGPGCYNLFLPLGKDLSDLAPYPESELRKQPLTRTVLTIRSAGYDPSTFPFLEQINERTSLSSPTFSERLEHAGRRLVALGAVSPEGVVTKIGERLRGIRARPELIVAVWHGLETGVAIETLIAGVAIEPGCSPFFHTKKDLKNVPFVTSEEVVRLILSHCYLEKNANGTFRAYYTRDTEIMSPHEVSLACLPPWIERRPDGLYTVRFLSEEGHDYLTDRGRHELALLLRRSFARGSGSDFVAIVHACRAFAAYRKELKIDGEACLTNVSSLDMEEIVHERRRKLKEWCEQRFLNFPNLQTIWRRVGETLADLKRAGAEIVSNVAEDTEFSSDALTQAILPLFDIQIAIKNSNNMAYEMDRRLVEPGWQSALRQFYPLPCFALLAEVRQGERRGETCYFAEFAAPLVPDWLPKTNPARWQLITHGKNHVSSAPKFEEVSLIDREERIELCRFQRQLSS